MLEDSQKCYNINMMQKVDTVRMSKFQLNDFVDVKQRCQDEYVLANIGADTAENGRIFVS